MTTKKFENFDTFKWKYGTQTSTENLMTLIPYTNQLKKVLADIKRGVFIKARINTLLETNAKMNVDILPSHIADILKEHRKDFYAMSKVVGKFTIKKQQYLKKVQELETLKDWLINQIEEI